MLCGYVAGSVARGLAVGAIVMLVSLYFTDLTIHNLFLVMVTTFFGGDGFFIGRFYQCHAGQ